MFKNRELRVRVAKRDETENTEQAEPKLEIPSFKDLFGSDPREIFITVSICVVGVIAAVAVANAAEEIAVHIAKTKIK